MEIPQPTQEQVQQQQQMFDQMVRQQDAALHLEARKNQIANMQFDAMLKREQVIAQIITNHASFVAMGLNELAEQALERLEAINSNDHSKKGSDSDIDKPQ